MGPDPRFKIHWCVEASRPLAELMNNGHPMNCPSLILRVLCSRETGATEGLQAGQGSQERRGRVGSLGSKDPLELLDQR